MGVTPSLRWPKVPHFFVARGLVSFFIWSPCHSGSALAAGFCTRRSSAHFSRLIPETRRQLSARPRAFSPHFFFTDGPSTPKLFSTWSRTASPDPPPLCSCGHIKPSSAAWFETYIPTTSPSICRCLAIADPPCLRHRSATRKRRLCSFKIR